MKRFALLLAAGLATASSAEVMQIVRTDAAGSEPDPPAGIITPMRVRPAEVPYAALRRLLLPDPVDRTPGNAAILYERAALVAAQVGDSHIGKLQEWLDLAADQVPAAETTAVFNDYRIALRELELAARRERCDWELPVRTEHIHLLLPELTHLRNLARALALRARLEIANGEIDDAIHDLQTGFALARHLGESPFVIHALVGLSVANLMTDATEELLQRPDAPSLYWALAFLPKPVVPIRPAIETEMNLGYYIAPQLLDADSRDRSPEQWQASVHDLADAWNAILSINGAPATPEWKGRLAIALMSVATYPDAKRQLVALGRPANEVNAMPVPQVIALAAANEFRHVRDETFKWFGLPFPDAYPRMRRASGLAIASSSPTGIIRQLAQSLLPVVSNVYLHQVAVDRRIAALQCVEAIRLHAGEHGGDLPASIGEITIVPVVDDPITGEPFLYERSGGIGTIRCPAPDGASIERFERTYAVTLAPASE